MTELNDKLISYGNLSTFYDKLQEQGLGGDAIEDASVLPDAGENKSKLFRLESDDNVYVSELKYRTSTTTNRLPDEQQIDKAYIYNTNNDTFAYYKGAWKLSYDGGVLDVFYWSGDSDWFYTYDNAENISNESLVINENMLTWVSTDETNRITVVSETKNIIDEVANELVAYDFYPIPAIYNAPEANQIGNAYMNDGNEFYYTGELKTFVCSDVSFDAYVWKRYGENYILLTEKPASEMYVLFNEDDGYRITDFQIASITPEEWQISGNTYTNTGVTMTSLFDTPMAWGIGNMYIPQLNASDSEQVDNAYIDLGYIYKYKGDTSCTILATEEGYEHTYYGYKWATDDNTYICFTSLKASEIYGQTTTTIYTNRDGNDDWTISGNTYEAFAVFSNTLYEMVDSYSTVKYQRTEVTEEWGWQDITPRYASDSDIDDLFVSESPVVKRVLMKQAKLDGDTEEPKYPLSLGEGLINISGETMVWDGDTYYKWVLYEENGGVSSIDYSIDGEHPMIYLTTTLNPTLPFDRDSSECAYVIAMDGDEDNYSGSSKIYIKEALYHEDGSITYEE